MTASGGLPQPKTIDLMLLNALRCGHFISSGPRWPVENVELRQ